MPKIIPRSDILFLGHILTGTMFFIQGTWWAMSAWHAYSLRRHRKGYYAQGAYLVLPGIRPRCIEGFFKIACGIIGIFAFGKLLIAHGLFEDARNAQHITFFMSLFLSGVFDLLTDHGAPLPPGTDYVGLLMGFSVEALLLYFHLDGRNKLDVLLHTLVFLTVVSEVACIAIEMVRRRSVLPTLGRTFFLILQGTWFLQIAFILYNQLPGTQPWEDTHESSMLASAVFTWHAIGGMLYLGLVGILVSLCSTKRIESNEAGVVYSAL